MDPSRPESPAEVEARRIREEAARRRPPTDRSGGDRSGGDPVAGALRSLPPGWSQVGVVPAQPPDRVVVGPGGVVVVRAFSPAGPLTLEPDGLHEGGVSSAVAASVLATVAAVRDLGGPAARRTTAVLCVASDVPVLRAADLIVCGAADLVRVLTAGPAVLAPGELAGAGIRLAAALRAGRDADDPTNPGSSPASRVPAAVKVAIIVLLLAALLLLAPRLGDGFGSGLGTGPGKGSGSCPAGSSSC